MLVYVCTRTCVCTNWKRLLEWTSEIQETKCCDGGRLTLKPLFRKSFDYLKNNSRDSVEAKCHFKLSFNYRKQKRKVSFISGIVNC